MPVHSRRNNPQPIPANHPVSSSAAVPSELRSWIRRRLLAWFDRHRRDLPWRRTRDPYAIWVSEVMLQQTQVATVIPYYERFLMAFPTLRDLARAEEQQVLKLWEGLGYYRRARDLHRAAQAVVAEHDGEVPTQPEQFGQLPGVGRYTLGAVLSQAFDRRLPILEANSLRVLARLIGYGDDPRSGNGLRLLWRVAEELLPQRRVGDFNQAIMELGALVCTPNAPACGTCPLAACCVACHKQLQDSIPAPPKQPETVDVHEVATVVRRDGTVLLVRRPPDGRWGGMWEFPHAPTTEEADPGRAAVKMLRELTGLDAALVAELLTIKHGVTRFRITLRCFDAKYRRGRFRSNFYVDAAWVQPADLAVYPISVPQLKIARSLSSSEPEA